MSILKFFAPLKDLFKERALTDEERQALVNELQCIAYRAAFKEVGTEENGDRKFYRHMDQATAYIPATDKITRQSAYYAKCSLDCYH